MDKSDRILDHLQLTYVPTFGGPPPLPCMDQTGHRQMGRATPRAPAPAGFPIATPHPPAITHTPDSVHKHTLPALALAVLPSHRSTTPTTGYDITLVYYLLLLSTMRIFSSAGKRVFYRELSPSISYPHIASVRRYTRGYARLPFQTQPYSLHAARHALHSIPVNAAPSAVASLPRILILTRR